MALTDIQRERYNRNILVKELGEEGQEKLLTSKVLVIGAGGLGSPNLLYLAAIGVGTIGIVDSDNVDITNLQRQIIHWTPDIGKPKIDSVKEKITKMNPDINVITYNERVDANNISDIIKDYDFIIECTDNFAAKYLINDACVLNKKPYSHCGVLTFNGQMITYTPGNTCLRCLYSSPPHSGTYPSSSDVGIFGTVPGIFGVLQTTEAVKYIIGKGNLLINTFLNLDVLNSEFFPIKVKPNSKCPICGDNPRITELLISEY